MVVFDVGQGNCNAIVGADGKVLAYYDFGYSNDGRPPATPTRLCFCDRPMIVLSHWDKDHINLASFVTECYTAEWLVPEAAHSDFATKLQKRIKQAGGRLHAVPHSGAARHQVFPWGYVERCSGPATDPNGSGLAAFVCVRNNPAHPVVAPAVAAVPGVAASTISPCLIRANTAYGLVAASVIALVPLADQPAVLPLARPLATVLAASQSIAAAGRQPHMPVPECVTAAVRAAERIAAHGENAVTAAGVLDGLLVLPTLRAHNVAWAQTVVLELTNAAVAAAAARSVRGKFRAAAGALTRDGKIPAEAWPWLGVRAARGLPGAQPPLLTGNAPYHRDERFILLNGDAEFQFVPSMHLPRRPRVVGMTAMHHGAIYEGTTQLDGASIPFAPGSTAAQSVLRFRLARTNAAGLTASVVSIATEAALAIQRRRQPHRRRELRVNISRVARAAAAAIHGLEVAHPGEAIAKPRKFAAAAAAAAFAAWRHPDARVVGLATLLASTVEGVTDRTNTSPLEATIAVAAKTVANPAMTSDQVKAISAGSLDGDLIPHVANIAGALVNVLLTADNAGQEAASALGELWASYKLGLAANKAKDFKNRIRLDNADENVLNDIATAATAAILASAPGAANRHTVAVSSDAAGHSIGVPGASNVALRASVVATMQASYWAAPALARDAVALDAARWAAERVAAALVGCTVEAIRTVIHAAHTPALRRDAYDAFGPRRRRVNGRGGHIVYSYGVHATDHSHGYAAQTVSAGYCGHPHPLALMKYEARGWIWRYNTSARARHAGAQGDPDKSHPFGHASLGWDSVVDAIHVPYNGQFRCGTCGKSFPICG